LSNENENANGPGLSSSLKNDATRGDLPTMPNPSRDDPEGGPHLPTMPDPAHDPERGQQLPTDPDPAQKPPRINDPLPSNAENDGLERIA
jgi:hypothetical protein